MCVYVLICVYVCVCLCVYVDIFGVRATVGKYVVVYVCLAYTCVYAWMLSLCKGIYVCSDHARINMVT